MNKIQSIEKAILRATKNKKITLIGLTEKEVTIALPLMNKEETKNTWQRITDELINSNMTIIKTQDMRHETPCKIIYFE
jgi:hypothetical protein